jgi:arylsulfatase A-like enzyme
VTVAEALRAAGYATYMTGKWHLAGDVSQPNAAWPSRRGFERYFGALAGYSYFQPKGLTRDEQAVDHEILADDFYYTDAVTDNAVAFIEEHCQRGDQPFFLYIAHYAPHWPLQARPDDIAKYNGRLDAGWDNLRSERLARLIDEGIVEPGSPLCERDPLVPEWSSVDDREWQARRMEVYAAQIDRMDQGVGRVLAQLEHCGRLDDALVIFLSDNGGCAEELPPDAFATPIGEELLPEGRVTRNGEPVAPGDRPGLMPGPESTYQAYGRAWAHLSNTPFREYKHWVHEGGISTPFIVHWPQGLADPGRLCTTPAQLTDVMPTLLEVAGAEYPRERAGRPVPPPEGRSLLPALRGEDVSAKTLYWEHEGNCAVRRGHWKLVRKHDRAWELYDIVRDQAERNDFSDQHPELVAELSVEYARWADRCGVIPRETILDLYKRRGVGAA